MNDEQYRVHCLEQLSNFAGFMRRQCEETSQEDPLRALSDGFDAIASGDGLYEDGPEVIMRLFTSCPQFAPFFPREILWFLGGDCLHVMPDVEIDIYQQLEEMRLEYAARGEIMNYVEARAKLLKSQ